MPETSLGEITVPGLSSEHGRAPASMYVASAAEVFENWRENHANQWYKDGADPNDIAGNYAFQRLRQTWFTPQIDPKFKLRRDDKFYAIGLCFARGLEYSLRSRKIAVESAAPEFARLVPVNKEPSGWGLSTSTVRFRS